MKQANPCRPISSLFDPAGTAAKDTDRRRKGRKKTLFRGPLQHAPAKSNAISSGTPLRNKFPISSSPGPLQQAPAKSNLLSASGFAARRDRRRRREPKVTGYGKPGVSLVLQFSLALHRRATSARSPSAKGRVRLRYPGIRAYCRGRVVAGAVARPVGGPSCFLSPSTPNSAAASARKRTSAAAAAAPAAGSPLPAAPRTGTWPRTRCTTHRTSGSAAADAPTAPRSPSPPRTPRSWSPLLLCGSPAQRPAVCLPALPAEGLDHGGHVPRVHPYLLRFHKLLRAGGTPIGQPSLNCSFISRSATMIACSTPRESPAISRRPPPDAAPKVSRNTFLTNERACRIPRRSERPPSVAR